jgi:hypothetical protein
MRRLLLTVVVTLCLSRVPVANAESPFDPLLKPVSNEANVLVLIDADRIRRTEFAKNIMASDADSAASTHIVARKELSQVLLAAHIRGFRESMIDWQTAVLRLDAEPSVAGVAASYSGSVDQVGKTEFAVLPYGAVAVVTGKQMLSVLTPPDRQQVSRVVRLASATKPAPQSEFLTTAINGLGPKTQALIAVDLEGMFSGSQVVRYVHDCETFQKRRDVRGSAITILETLQTLMVRIQIGTGARAQVSVTFSQDIPDITAWGGELFREVLSDAGAWIDDAQSWEVRQDGRSLLLEGDLSLTGLRTIFTLVEFPTEVPTEYKPGAVLSPEEEKQRMAKASLTRFRACDKLVQDLKKDDRARAPRMGENALWFDRYARQIETLPSLNVDQEVLDYCDDVVLRLRVQATRYRMGSSKVSQERSTPNYFWGSFNSYYGATYSYWTKDESDASRVKRQERAGSAMDRAEQFQAIADEGTKTRRAMTAKYNVEF